MIKSRPIQFKSKTYSTPSTGEDHLNWRRSRPKFAWFGQGFSWFLLFIPVHGQSLGFRIRIPIKKAGLYWRILVSIFTSFWIQVGAFYIWRTISESKASKQLSLGIYFRETTKGKSLEYITTHLHTWSYSEPKSFCWLAMETDSKFASKWPLPQ